MRQPRSATEPGFRCDWLQAYGTIRFLNGRVMHQIPAIPISV
ncbi:hypothetical protein [Effusibacillus pohliae]